MTRRRILAFASVLDISLWPSTTRRLDPGWFARYHGLGCGATLFERNTSIFSVGVPSPIYSPIFETVFNGFELAADGTACGLSPMPMVIMYTCIASSAIAFLTQRFSSLQTPLR
ncbi:hypothetical protein FRB95_014105 [Tulasnella sp. JGI-2019a]|nr:hypothetical protein FRB95_014105 [Tulasnella sp. JGI-2019a]